ncbi:hypothetical protein [Ekhidna sp.]|uniref:hypothetical protein n=1 Tax=Ekhidna sp. TaxID=2608089 RepID=UPI0032F04239
MSDTNKPLINGSYRALRRAIGILGILLPWILMLRTMKVEPSISHYYYTIGTPIFTGVLILWAVFLLSYRGHPLTATEKVSDNKLTNIAGFFALIPVFIPTTCHAGQCHTFCHYSSVIGAIHLVSAGLFLFFVGAMSFFKFPLGGKKVRFYKTMGIIVWASIALMLIYFGLEKRFNLKEIFPNGILIGEIIGVTAFGISWLMKGKPEEMVIFKKRNHKSGG